MVRFELVWEHKIDQNTRVTDRVVVSGFKIALSWPKTQTTGGFERQCGRGTKFACESGMTDLTEALIIDRVEVDLQARWIRSGGR